ncbi:putative Xaa-Pro aminopeptidase [Xylariales sp. AK1849]|nr:putative Xaa-Pro aminopeptidase [Xylariales sp. AK1849]
MATRDAVDHKLVAIDEFDALAIEIKSAVAESPISQPPVSSKIHVSTRPLSNKYPAKEHAKKVAEELGVKNGFIYLPGKLEQTWEDSDMGPPFRQRRYFYYLSGADFPGCAVTYDLDKDSLTLWIPYSPPQTVLWFGTTPTPAECLEKSDLDDARYISELPEYMIGNLPHAGPLYVLRESQLPRFKDFEILKPHLKIDSVSLLPAISEARVVKTDYEIAMIRRANDISSEAHKAVCQQLLTLENECQVEAIFQAACLKRNSHSQSYPIIAGAGKNAASLHYVANNEPLTGRQLLVLDAGAEWEVYASDITRTLPIGGKFTEEGKAAYDLVARMQEECISRIKPGTVYYSLHLHAHLVATKGLMQLGVLHNGTVKEIFANGTSAAFFPHGLGHHVGLEVHDVGGKERLMLHANGACRGNKRTPVSPETIREMIALAPKTVDINGPPYSGRRRLEKNMIVTVEPGIYFCKEYIEAYFLKRPEHAKYINTKVLDKYWDVGGVRIEDDILVTEDGHENLSWAPKGDEGLRIINGE